MFKKFLPKGNINLMNNKVLLYTSLLASLINLLSFALLGDYLIPIVFILVAFVTSFFSKNMTVILLTALAISNIIKYGTKIRVNEGFQESVQEGLLDPSMNKIATKAEVNESMENSEPATEEVPMTEFSKLEPSKFNAKKRQLKELVEIQRALTQNMNNVEKTLSRAEVLVENLKEGMDLRR